MWKLKRRTSLLRATAVTALAAAFITTTAIAQTAASYPGKPVRVILPYAPGGGTSTVMRVFSDKLSKELGQAFILDNRPGGNTIIGSEAMVRSAPDGHTLLTVTNSHIVNPFFMPKLPYDTLKDFAAISTLTRSDYMLTAYPGFPANTLKEFIAYARQNPGRINGSTVGLGSVQHLVNELFMQASGTKFVVVPYKGAGPATADLMAGVVQLGFKNVSNVAAGVKAGKLKGLAVSGDRRSPVLPDVPTFAEAGLPSFVAANWFALLAPSATPRDIIQKLNEQVGKAQASADVQDLLAKQGIDPFPNSVAATEALIRSDMERYGKVIRDNNIKADTDS